MSLEKAAHEKEIMKRFERTGELDYEPIFKNNAPRLLRIAAAVLGSQHEAENAVQETFFDVYRYVVEGNFDSRRGTISGLLHKSLKNRCFDFLRKKSPEVTFEEEKGGKVVDLKSWAALGENPQEILMRRELVDDVGKALQKLPERLRLALLFRVVGEATYERLAEMMDTSPTAARMAVSRARALLRKLIDKEKGAISQ